MQEAIAKGQISGDGEFTRRCQNLAEQELGGSVLLTTSCTHALEMAALLLDIAPGDEVIIPDFTFVSTANAFVLRGATPVFVDVRPDTLNLDERLIEDADHAAHARDRPGALRGRRLRDGRDRRDRPRRPPAFASSRTTRTGSSARRTAARSARWGDLATSQLPRDEELQLRRGRRPRRQRSAISSNAPRSSARRAPTAAVLPRRGRQVHVGGPRLELRPVGPAGRVPARHSSSRRRPSSRRGASPATATRPRSRPGRTVRGSRCRSSRNCDSSFHMFYLVMATADAQTRLIAHLKYRGILAVFHYLPLHLSKMGSGWGARPGDCPVTESVSERLVRLPLFTSITEDEQDRVIDAVLRPPLSDRTDPETPRTSSFSSPLPSRRRTSTSRTPSSCGRSRRVSGHTSGFWLATGKSSTSCARTALRLRRGSSRSDAAREQCSPRSPRRATKRLASKCTRSSRAGRPTEFPAVGSSLNLFRRHPGARARWRLRRRGALRRGRASRKSRSGAPRVRDPAASRGARRAPCRRSRSSGPTTTRSRGTTFDTTVPASGRSSRAPGCRGPASPTSSRGSYPGCSRAGCSWAAGRRSETRAGAPCSTARWTRPRPRRTGSFPRPAPPSAPSAAGSPSTRCRAPRSGSPCASAARRARAGREDPHRVLVANRKCLGSGGE